MPHGGPIFEKIVRNQAAFRSPSVVLAERRLVMQLGGFDEQLSSAEDFDLYVRLALQSEIALVDEPLVYVRVHEDNYSSADPASGLTGRDHALRKLQGSAPVHWRALLREERANTALELAATYSVMNRPATVLSSIRNSVGYSWPFPRWWWGVSKAMVRTAVPKRLLEFRHSLRAAAAAPPATRGAGRNTRGEHH